MANFLIKIAQVVLFMYCLTQTHIECGKDNDIKLTRRSEPKRATELINKDGCFTIIEDDNPPRSCGAVWISGSCLLTAASCLDKGGKIDLSKTKNSLIKIRVKQNYKTKVVLVHGYAVDDYVPAIGAAIAHPLYRRVGAMTIAYDLAVVRVNFDEKFHNKHKSGTLCKKDNPNPRLIALGLRDSSKIVWQWPLEKKADKNIALVYNHGNKRAEEYFIDHRKQFTTYLNRRAISGSIFAKYGFGAGGPVLDENNGRCILGIMNFAATRKDKLYITSTNVTPVINWIKYTMNYLRNVAGQSKLTKLRGKAGLKFWNLRGFNPDPIGTDLPSAITPGMPVDKKKKVNQANQENLWVK